MWMVTRDAMPSLRRSEREEVQQGLPGVPVLLSSPKIRTRRTHFRKIKKKRLKKEERERLDEKMRGRSKSRRKGIL